MKLDKKALFEFFQTFMENLIKTTIVIFSGMACIAAIGIAWGILGFIMSIAIPPTATAFIAVIGFLTTCVVFLITLLNTYC